MRKLYKVLLVTFVAGVLLGGIGLGIAFGEYSSFHYGGKVILGEESLVTEEFGYTFMPSREQRIRLWGNYGGNKNNRIVKDNSLPVGEICYKVTYNEGAVQPYLSYADSKNWNPDLINDRDWDSAWEKAEAMAKREGWAIDSGSVSKAERSLTILSLEGCYTSGFSILMQNKDRILNELKHRTISEYEVVDVAEVEVRMNPKTLMYVDYDESWNVLK